MPFRWVRTIAVVAFVGFDVGHALYRKFALAECDSVCSHSFNNCKLFVGIICSTYWWSDNWIPTWCCHIEEFTHIAVGEILVLDSISRLYYCTHCIYCCCHCHSPWLRAI